LKLSGEAWLAGYSVNQWMAHWLDIERTFLARNYVTAAVSSFNGMLRMRLPVA
jgi:hypothetical protein